MDDFSKQLVPVIDIPVHQLKELCKEEFPRHLSWLSLFANCIAPCKCISLKFGAGTQRKDARLPIDQELDTVCVRELVQASGVDIDFVVVERYRWFESVCKKLPSNHLVSVKIKVIMKLDHIARCGCINGHWRNRVLHKGNNGIIIGNARRDILRHWEDERTLIFCFHSVLLSFISDKIQRISDLAQADTETSAKQPSYSALYFAMITSCSSSDRSEKHRLTHLPPRTTR